MAQIDDRVPVILTASHFSARVTAERCRRAENGGAAAIMLMPPYHGATIRVADDAIRGYFETVAAATDLPIVIQDSPVAGTPLSVALLRSLAETVPTIAYFKLETPDATVKLGALLDGDPPGILGPFDGEEGINLVPDLDAGATGTMPSAMIPDVLGEVVRMYLAGERESARAALRTLVAAGPLREPPVRPPRDEGAHARRRHHRVGGDESAAAATQPTHPERPHRVRPTDGSAHPAVGGRLTEAAAPALRYQFWTEPSRRWSCCGFQWPATAASSFDSSTSTPRPGASERISRGPSTVAWTGNISRS